MKEEHTYIFFVPMTIFVMGHFFGGIYMEKKMDLKKISIIALLSALAFLMVAVIRIPVVAFLKYEPKDVIIVIGGFIYSPLVSIIISVFSHFLRC